MKLHRHLCIVLQRLNARGDPVCGWKLEDRHLYRVRWTHSRGNPSNRWWNWELVL